MSCPRPRVCGWLILLLIGNLLVWCLAAPGVRQHIHALRYGQQYKDLNKAIDLNNEGMQLFRQGRYEQAHKKLTKSLEIKERLHGRDTTMVAVSLMNLGDNYLAWGKYDEAEKVAKEALRIRREENDPEVRYSEELLGDIQKARRKAARAQAAAAGAKPAAAVRSSPSSQQNSSSSSTSSSASGAAASSRKEPPLAPAGSVASVAVAVAAVAAVAVGAARRLRRSDAARCAACGAIGVTKSSNATPDKPCLKKCSGCRTVYYCNRRCQIQDWPRHRADCQPAAQG